ncbi:histone-lysine N-methyltransferase SETMAR [Trichonephila clavipes]|nr:histone-lysine N-methyltransferase SETMAR [Trichonephila clavipes]
MQARWLKLGMCLRCRYCNSDLRAILVSSIPFRHLDVKDAPRTDRPVVENVDKTTEIIEVDRHVRIRSNTQELKIDHKKILSHLRKVGFRKKLEVWEQHQLTPINIIGRISIYKVLSKRNEINAFLKWMVTGDEKWVTYDNIVGK